MNASDAPVEKPKLSKSTWDVVLTSTPVILTVMATVLAGLSSSEMTLSQYFRSLATQNQSKVADQWAFFQAKRIRGTSVEMEVSLLPVVARPGKLEPAALLTASESLTARLKLAEHDAAPFTNPPDKEFINAELRLAVERFQKKAKENAVLAEQNTTALGEELKKVAVASSFAYLGTKLLPKVEDQSNADEDIQRTLQMISQRDSEKDIARVVLKVKPDSLENELAVARGNASRFEDAGDVVGKNLRATESLITQQGVLTAEVYQAYQELEGKAAIRSAGNGMPSFAPETPKHIDAMRRSADNLTNLYKAASHDYTARRYRQEAFYNQRLAELYEVPVYRNSALSDVHRMRSRNFFFGMLGAQAGVAIAAFSLAARQKSVLWSLAAFAGLGALIFSGYVYLFM